MTQQYSHVRARVQSDSMYRILMLKRSRTIDVETTPMCLCHIDFPFIGHKRSMSNITVYIIKIHHALSLKMISMLSLLLFHV